MALGDWVALVGSLRGVGSGRNRTAVRHWRGSGRVGVIAGLIALAGVRLYSEGDITLLGEWLAARVKAEAAGGDAERP